MKKFSDFLSEAKKKAEKPKILKRLESQLADKGFSAGSAAAIARSTLQKSGSLKKGSQELTKKGKKRQKMGAAGRAKHRAAKKSGRKASEYKYNPRNNQATLREELIFESLLAEGTRHLFFDFDETLATDEGAEVKVGDRSFSAAAFSAYQPKPGDPEPDYSAFRRVNKPVIKKKHFSFNVLKNAARKLARRKAAGEKDLPVLGIITARPQEVAPHIHQWLKDNGIDNAHDIHIHGVSSPDPQAKAKALRTHIDSGFIKPGDQVHFFDDHHPNVEAIAGMRQDHPDINIRSVHVGPQRKKGK
jgi:hypothetical protein